MRTLEIGLIDVLKLAGFDPDLPTKLIRHQDGRNPIQDLIRRDCLEHYQSYQGDPHFHGARQIISFSGLAGSRATFYGVYKLLGYRAADEGPILPFCAESAQWKQTSKFFYDLERDVCFDDLRGRLIIDWGPGTRTWVQNLVNKTVTEILPSGRKLVAFDDYLEFSLSHTQLKDLFENEEAHPDWKTPLSAVAGIYLILAEKSGNLYVGSASGEEGVWGRWRDYAKLGHGGNVHLQELINSDPDYPERFRFSVLRTLPKTMTRVEVYKRETLYKQKLGSRATGLNS